MFDKVLNAPLVLALLYQSLEKYCVNESKVTPINLSKKSFEMLSFGHKFWINSSKFKPKPSSSKNQAFYTLLKLIPVIMYSFYTCIILTHGKRSKNYWLFHVFLSINVNKSGWFLIFMNGHLYTLDVSRIFKKSKKSVRTLT